MRKILNIFLGLLGVGLLTFLIYKSEPIMIFHQLQAIKWEYFCLLVMYTFLWRYLHALAFYILCNLKQTKQGAYIITQILSNTVSDVFMVGNAGGEIYRAYKLTQYYPQYKDIFIGRTILYNTFYAIAILLVFLTSSIFLAIVWSFPPTIHYIFIMGILILAICIIILLFLQSRGMVGFLLQLFLKIPIIKLQDKIKNLIKIVQPIDNNMKGFIHSYPYRTGIFIFLMYVSRLLTIGEGVIIGAALGISFSFSDAVFINFVDSFVRLVFFIVPNGQLGVLEVFMISISSLLGQSQSTMMSFTLVQRAKTLIWSILGFMIMFIEKLKGKFYG